MPSLPSRSIQQDLRRIADIARSVSSTSSHLVTIDDTTMTHRHIPADLQLPAPPKIETALVTLGLKPAVFDKLSRAYETLALELKHVSEIRLRNMVYACDQINTRFGLPNTDSYRIRKAVTAWYLRTLHETVARMLQLSQKHFRVMDRAFYPLDIPRTMSLSPSTFESDCSLLLLRSPKAVAVRSCTPQLPTKAASQSPLPYVNYKAVSFCDLQRGGHEHKHSVLPIFKARLNESEGMNSTYEDFMATQPSKYSYPARYTHPESPTSPVFTPHRDFRPCVTPRHIPAIISAPRLNDVLDEIDRLSLSDSPRRVKREETESTSVPQSTSSTNGLLEGPQSAKAIDQSGDSARSSPRSISSQISLASFTHSTVSQTRTSKAVPRRARRTTSQKDTPHPYVAPLEAAGSASMATSMMAPRAMAVKCSDPFVSESSPSPSLNAQTRRRKVAPLPHRRPASSLSSGITSPTSTSSSETNHFSPNFSRGSQPAIPRTPSRTPSLRSLASSRSGSPCPVDHCIDTPPSSPRLHAFGGSFYSISPNFTFSADSSSMSSKHIFPPSRIQVHGDISQLEALPSSFIGLDVL